MTPKALLEKALAIFSMMKEIEYHEKVAILRLLDTMIAVEQKNAEIHRSVGGMN